MYSFAFGRYVRIMTCSVRLDLDGTLIDNLATSKRAIFASRILDHLKFATYSDGIYGSVPSSELVGVGRAARVQVLNRPPVIDSTACDFDEPLH